MYGQTGSELTVCGVTCSSAGDMVELRRTCGGIRKTLLQLYCRYGYTINPEPRVHLNTSSGCWTLSRAQRSDSCVYEVFSEQDTAPLFSEFIQILGEDGLEQNPSLVTPLNGTRREYQPEIRAPASSRGRSGVAAVGVTGVLAAVVFCIVYQKCKKRRQEGAVITEDPPPHGDRDSLQIISEEPYSIPQEDTGFISVSVKEGRSLAPLGGEKSVQEECPPW